MSVAKTLSSNGVDPARFEIAGYGEYRPIVANRMDGTKENRRVEIYLRPTADSMDWSTASVTSTTETVTIDPMEEPMK